jgi:hypothetical protein
MVEVIVWLAAVRQPFTASVRFGVRMRWGAADPSLEGPAAAAA